MSNELTVLGGFQIPDYVKAFEAKNDDFGVAGGLPTISMRQDKSGFTLRKDGVDTILPSPLPVIILGVSPAGKTLSRSYYSSTYVPGTTDPPDCSSNNGIVPDMGDNRQNADCATCPQAVFGSSSTGKGQACTQHKTMFIVPANNPSSEVFQQRVAVTSLKNIAVYGRDLTNHNVDKAAVITLLGYADTPAEILHPVLALSVGGFLSEEQGFMSIERSNNAEILNLIIPEPVDQLPQPTQTQPTQTQPTQTQPTQTQPTQTQPEQTEEEAADPDAADPDAADPDAADPDAADPDAADSDADP